MAFLLVVSLVLIAFWCTLDSVVVSVAGGKETCVGLEVTAISIAKVFVGGLVGGEVAVGVRSRATSAGLWLLWGASSRPAGSMDVECLE